MMNPFQRKQRKQPERSQRFGHLPVIVAVLILVVTGSALGLWRPWQDRSDRVIQVNGRGTISAVPDEYVFRASYEFKSTDQQAAHDEADKKHQELFARLQELSVSERNIKVNMHRTERPLRDGVSDETTYTLILSATTQDQHQKKVHDYLTASMPSSSISQHLQFSEQKRKTIEHQGIAAAVRDARGKAERSAQALGLSVGGVKKISDGFAFGYPTSWDALDTSTEYNAVLHPGENDISYTVMTTFTLK